MQAEEGCINSINSERNTPRICFRMQDRSGNAVDLKLICIESCIRCDGIVTGIYCNFQINSAPRFSAININSQDIAGHHVRN